MRRVFQPRPFKFLGTFLEIVSFHIHTHPVRTVAIFQSTDFSTSRVHTLKYLLSAIAAFVVEVKNALWAKSQVTSYQMSRGWSNDTSGKFGGVLAGCTSGRLEAEETL